MARELSWSDVRGGVIALVVLVASALSIMWFLRVGVLRGDTYIVHALVGDASALAPGSEVWLSGQKVGKVKKISFRPASTDTATRLVVDMQLLGEHRQAIHKDATAQVRAGGSFIGAIVVYLTPGTMRTPVLAEGDTIVGKPLGTLESAATQVQRITREVPPLFDSVGLLAKQLSSPRGTVGAVMNGGGLKGMDVFQRRASALMTRAGGGGDGTVGRIMAGGLSARASRVMARADSVRALLASPNTSLGRFRKDSTLMAEVGDIRAELARVQQALDEPRGTAGRVLRDSALTNGLASAQREMSLLFADIKKHPLRYLSF